MCDCEVISTDNVYDMLSHAAVEENVRRRFRREVFVVLPNDYIII